MSAEPAERTQAIAGRVRPATDADLPAIARIYGYYVEHTPATFDIEPPSVEEWQSRWQVAGENDRPWFVSEADDGVVGFVVMSGFRPKGAYRATVETTIYFEQRAVGHGLGRPLYATALEEAARRGFHVAVAGITLPNRGSVELHEAMGFTRVGLFEEVGHKLGDWRSVEWWQRRL